MLFKVTVTLTSGLNSGKNRIHNTSPKLFEVAISNSVYGCILMLAIAAY